MNGASKRWTAGVLWGLACLGSLIVASKAGHGLFYYLGLIVFGFSVLVIYNLIRVSFDAAEGKEEGRSLLIPIMLVGVAVGTVVFHVVSPWWWAPIASNWGYIDTTINLTFWITGLTFVAVLFFMAYCALRFAHRKGQKAAYEPESKKLEIILTAVTAVGVAAMLAPGLFVWNQFVDVPEEADQVEVVGQQWAWSYRLPGEDGQLGRTNVRLIGPENPLGLDPNDPASADDVIIDGGALHLPVGRPVEVKLRALDVLHSFYVPEFRAKMDMVPGTVTRLWFEPTRTGDFQILCAELCGVAHAYMRGDVVVQEEADYLAWLADQQTFSQLAGRSAQPAEGVQLTKAGSPLQ
jgi:cytochrome c oxidase subunit 2